jgi:hypothetical protein
MIKDSQRHLAETEEKEERKMERKKKWGQKRWPSRLFSPPLYVGQICIALRESSHMRNIEHLDVSNRAQETQLTAPFLP